MRSLFRTEEKETMGFVASFPRQRCELYIILGLMVFNIFLVWKPANLCHYPIIDETFASTVPDFYVRSSRNLSAHLSSNNETTSSPKVAPAAPGLYETPQVDWNFTNSKNVQLDIGVPVSAENDKLIQFAKVLGTSISEFRRNVIGIYKFRLLITRYPKDKKKAKLLREKLLKLSHVDSVLFIVVNKPRFHRAEATNAIHKNACESEQCVLTIVDVDMELEPGYLRNALLRAAPKTIYFPVVWSQYRPSSVALVEALGGPLAKFSAQRGLWREFGYGMYAMSGKDALTLMMDEANFKGWGGEDIDFYNRSKTLSFRIIRQRDPYLVHRWHPKICRLGSTVERALYESW